MSKFQIPVLSLLIVCYFANFALSRNSFRNEIGSKYCGPKVSNNRVGRFIEVKDSNDVLYSSCHNPITHRVFFTHHRLDPDCCTPPRYNTNKKAKTCENRDKRTTSRGQEESGPIKRKSNPINKLVEPFKRLKVDKDVTKWEEPPCTGDEKYSTKGSTRSRKKIPFDRGNFFKDVDMENLMGIKMQQRVFSSALGLKKNYKIENDNINFLAKGHLASDCDFSMATREATYFYFNAAPQWQSFNNGNWKMLEARVRKLSKARCLHVFTGVSLDSLQLEGRNISLDVLDKNNRFIKNTPEGRIAVPEYFWKLLIDSSRKQAIAIVGINNIHENIYSSKYQTKCKRCDLSKVSWFIQGKFTSFKEYKKGYLFCCTFSEFLALLRYNPAHEIYKDTDYSKLIEHELE